MDWRADEDAIGERDRRRGARRPGLVLGLLAASLGSCVATMYAGPRRPDHETMLVETDGTTLVRIDDVQPVSSSAYRLLPGAHHLDVVLDDGKMGGAVRTSTISAPASGCRSKAGLASSSTSADSTRSTITGASRSPSV